MKLNSIQQKKSAETDCVQQRVIIPLCTTTVGPHLDNWLFQGTPRRAHHSSERTGDFTFDLSFSSLVSTSAFRQPPASLETSLTVYQVLDKGCSAPFSALFFSRIGPGMLSHGWLFTSPPLQLFPLQVRVFFIVSQYMIPLSSIGQKRETSVNLLWKLAVCFCFFFLLIHIVFLFCFILDWLGGS